MWSVKIMISELVNKVTKNFERIVGVPAKFVVQAPGRVNLIGEHTDYNDGFVLPCAINFQVVVCANRRDDNVVRVFSLDYKGEIDEFLLSQDIVPTTRVWSNYVRGVVKHLRLLGYEFSGADIAISGNVPQGAGLSSSAALEVAIGQVFKTMYSLDISQKSIALNGQAAENQFVGCQCGIMDQLISAQAEEGCALLIDCRSLLSTAVPLPQGMAIVIVNSNKNRGLVDSEYNLRREQCESAAKFFQVKALRDVNSDDFLKKSLVLDPIIARRAKHIITENERTLAAAKALAENDIISLQSLMAESHASMRDDFEITVPEIDALVDIIKAEVGELGGVRMTGGGFGGCVVALIPDDLIEQVTRAVKSKYSIKTGLEPSIFICSAASGASEVSHE
jgi:galactokinase